MIHTSSNPWRAVLHARFRLQPIPLLVTPDALWTAASLWAGTRAWTQAFRAMRLEAGDALQCELPAGPAFAQVLLACLWEGVTFTMPDTVARAPAEAIAPRVIVASSARMASGAPVLVPDAASQPPGCVPHLTRGATRATGFGEALLEAATRAGAVHRLGGACVLSCTAWTTTAALVTAVLAPLLHADELIVADSACPATVLRLAHDHPVSHLCATDADVHALRSDPAAREILDRLTICRC